jgi:type IV pilus assembly protein PilC
MLGEQTENAALQKGIMQAITGINEGESLATAMRRSPKAFDETLVSLVRAGEASGSLDVSLERMAVQYKKDAHIKASVKKAVTYPVIVLVVAFAVVIFMLLVVVPNFMDMFDDIGIEMPKITLMVVAASEWVQQYWYILAIVIVAVVSGFILFKRSPTGHKALSWLTLHLPGVNQFVVKSNAAKIARTLSTLLAAGMSIIEAVDILRSTMSNYYYESAIDEVRKDILTGRQMSAKFRENPDLFPNMLVHMISVGEDTGDTTSMLIRTADYYDLEVDGAVSTMMDMLSPAIMLLLVGIVGVLIAAVLMPMVTLYSELGDAL